MKTLIKTITAIAISATLLTSCSGEDGEDGKDGVNGINGINGTSCEIKTATAPNDWEILCGGVHVGYLNNGETGAQGLPGDKGDKGDPGENGTSCSIAPLADHPLYSYEVFCGNVSVGYLNNGDKGDKGDKGDNGVPGENGTSCSIAPLVAHPLYSYEVFCGNVSVGYLNDGMPGTPGASCDVAEDGAYFVMTCGDVEKARWAKAMCGATPYNPDVYSCCGTNVYDPGNYSCNAGSNVIAKAVKKIGSETWFLRDLAYGSKTTFTWAEAMEACPIGWHLPTDTEWEDLGNANDLTNFPINITWWSATEGSNAIANTRGVYSNTLADGNDHKTNNNSVRCVKD